jgi:bifunctional non-homologous end joining protein LigD
MPLRWDELGKIKSGAAFNIKSAPKRLARMRKDPWEDLPKVRQSLDTVVKQLGRKPR